MFKFVILVSGFGILLTAFSSSASARQTADISGGFVFPSINSAVLENPAAFGHLRGKVLDAGVATQTGVSIYQGSLAISGGGSGFGLSYYQTHGTYLGPDRSAVALGAGHEFGRLSLGMSAASDLADVVVVLDAGLMYSGNSLTLTAVARDVLDFNGRFDAGLGVELARGILMEGDMMFWLPRGSDSSIAARLGMLFLPTPRFSLGVRYPFYIVPELDLGSTSSLELGANWWIASNFGVYFLYQYELKYTAGLKLSF